MGDRSAPHVPPARYLRFDVDERTLEDARSRNPSHRFTSRLPAADVRFDTFLASANQLVVLRPA